VPTQELTIGIPAEEEGHSMPEKVADLLWEMLANAGVKRCYGIVGDALNPVIDGLRRNGRIEFVHVRHEEYGVFAAVAEAYLTDNPVAVCGTAGPGVVHLFNGLMDARKEGAPIIAIAGDVETNVLDTAALEELNPYKFLRHAYGWQDISATAEIAGFSARSLGRPWPMPRPMRSARNWHIPAGRRSRYAETVVLRCSISAIC
jgi:thiamine pyrophosphate-dependent enzyme